MNRFLSLGDLTIGAIQKLLKRAKEMEARPLRDDLKGKVVGLVFMNPSLRTLASFQAGVAQLGGNSFVIQPGAGSWTLETRDGVMDGAAPEHLREAIPVLAEYADLLGFRAFAPMADLEADLEDGLIRRVAALNPKPTINLESAADHPCQALADWKTLDDIRIPHGGKFVLAWAWHPKPLPYAVPRAAAAMAALRGMKVTILRPEGYDLPPGIASQLSFVASAYDETSDVREAMEGASVLYCKSWCAAASYSDPAAEIARREGLRDWCVRESWFEGARPDARFMHCLPVRRNVKVADEVLDGPRSEVIRQARNRLHVQKSVLIEMLGGEGA